MIVFTLHVRLVLAWALAWVALPASSLAAEDFCVVANSDGTREIDVDLEPAHRKSTKVAADFMREVADCVEEQKKSVGLVTGGAPALTAFFTDVVRIRFTNRRGRTATCSGVIIAEDTILTAGHCGCGFGYQAEIQIDAKKNESPRFYALELSESPELFPGYNCALRRAQPGRDLAILRYEPFGARKEGPTEFDNGKGGVDPLVFAFPIIRPALRVLSRQNRLKNLYLAGFGSDESGELVQVLTGVYIDIYSRHCQRGRVRRSRCASFREFVLAGTQQAAGDIARDSCGGDSGGPVYKLSRLEYDVGVEGIGVPRKILVGVVSRALLGVRQIYPGYCGGGGIYTSVGTKPVIDWLKAQNVNFRFEE